MDLGLVGGPISANDQIESINPVDYHATSTWTFVFQVSVFDGHIGCLIPEDTDINKATDDMAFMGPSSRKGNKELISELSCQLLKTTSRLSNFHLASSFGLKFHQILLLMEVSISSRTFVHRFIAGAIHAGVKMLQDGSSICTVLLADQGHEPTHTL